MLGGGLAGKGRGKDEGAGSRGRKSGGGEASGRRSSPEARAAGRRGSGSRSREGGRSGSNTRPAGSKAQPSGGDDGFTAVRRKGWGPRRGHRDAAGSSAGRENGEDLDNGGASESGSDWQASGSDHGESDGDQPEESEEPEESKAEEIQRLRDEWEQAKKIRVGIRRNGGKEGDKAFEVALECEREAEARWKEERGILPINRRQRKAREALERAEASVRKAKEKLEELDREYYERAEELDGELRASEEKAARLKAEVVALNREEDGETGGGNKGFGAGAEKAMEMVSGGLGNLGARLFDLVNDMGESEVKLNFQEVVQDLHQLWAQTEAAKKESVEAERFDIGSRDIVSVNGDSDTYSHGYLEGMVPEFADNCGRRRKWNEGERQKGLEGYGGGNPEPANKSSREEGAQSVEGAKAAPKEAAEAPRGASRSAERKQKGKETADKAGKEAVGNGGAYEHPNDI